MTALTSIKHHHLFTSIPIPPRHPSPPTSARRIPRSTALVNGRTRQQAVTPKGFCHDGGLRYSGEPQGTAYTGGVLSGDLVQMLGMLDGRSGLKEADSCFCGDTPDLGTSFTFSKQRRESRSIRCCAGLWVCSDVRDRRAVVSLAMRPTTSGERRRAERCPSTAARSAVMPCIEGLLR